MAKQRLVINGLDPRDGPTPEWRQHHEAIMRRSSPGHRRYSLAEKLLEGNEITPQECGACRRFAKDYAVGIIGSSRGSMVRVDGRGVGVGHPSDDKLDCTAAHNAAAAALDGSNMNPNAGGVSAADLMIMFCYQDLSFRAIGRATGLTDITAKTRIMKHVVVLTLHYAEVDKKRGRSTTPHTKEGVRRMMDPDDRPTTPGRARAA